MSVEEVRKKSHKRKHKEQNHTEETDQVKIKKKKKKIKETDENDIDQESEKTLKEIKEAKIKNVKKLKSDLLETPLQHEKNTDKETVEKAKEIEEMKERKREKRRKKKEALRQQKLAQKNKESDPDGESTSIAKTEALKYLRTWNDDREKWKFNKVRQVWLLKHMYDQKQVGEDDFEILLQYLDGMKGKSRDQTVQEAEKLISQSGNDSNDEDDGVAKSEHSLSPVQSERIRKVLQILS